MSDSTPGTAGPDISKLTNTEAKKEAKEEVNEEVKEEVKEEEEVKQDYPVFLKQICRTLLQTGHLADVVFLIGEERILAHRLLLAHVSPVFDAMLYPRDSQGRAAVNAPSELLTVPLDFPDAAAFKTALEIIYCGDAAIPLTHVKPLLAFASQFDVSSVQTLCSKHLQVTPSNALEMFQLGPALSRPNLGLQMLRENITNLIQTQEFKQMKQRDLVRLLQLDDLGGVREHQLFLAVVEWAKAEAKRQLNTPKQAAAELIKLIRFPTMTVQEIAGVVPTGLLDQTQLTELFTWVTVDEQHRKFLSPPAFPTIPRLGRLQFKGTILTPHLLAQLATHLDHMTWKLVLTGDSSTKIAEFEEHNTQRCIMVIAPGNGHIFGFHTTQSWHGRTGGKGSKDEGAFLFSALDGKSELKIFRPTGQHHEPLWGTVNSSWRFGYAFGTNNVFDRWFTKPANAFGVHPSEFGWQAQWNTPQGLKFEMFQMA
eukprot:gb/GEZN01006884.1/.p1 GENE.gb/GEZN01006884.1/~~gb/GEZN01006884.1/.p1  ORF type:complete len:481 (+),score=82.82 gb/GEZN01006884.1/:105-1547(+)